LLTERQLLSTVIYRGPDDEGKAIVDNVDSCTFDSSLGRWTLSTSGYEKSPANTNSFLVAPPDR
jgi:hypothetical protein